MPNYQVKRHNDRKNRHKQPRYTSGFDKLYQKSYVWLKKEYPGYYEGAPTHFQGKWNRIEYSNDIADELEIMYNE